MKPIAHPLSPADARLAVLAALNAGRLVLTVHCEKQMVSRRMTSVDVVNVLRGGLYLPAEEENGAWRYQATTERMRVVVEIVQDGEAIQVTVVTAIRRTR